MIFNSFDKFFIKSSSCKIHVEAHFKFIKFLRVLVVTRPLFQEDVVAKDCKTLGTGQLSTA